MVLLLVATSVPLAGLVHHLTIPVEASAVIPVLVSAAVGVVVARHQPGNALGWLLILFTLLVMLSIDAGYYAVLCYSLGHHGPLAPVVVLLVPLWAPAAALFGLVILLFPDGRLTSRRWLWVLWAYAGLVACYTAVSFARTIAALTSHAIRLDSAGGVISTQDLPGWFAAVIFVPIVAIWLSFAARQVLSWRHATGERRQQLKWLASGTVVTIGVGVAGSSLAAELGGRYWDRTTALLSGCPKARSPGGTGRHRCPADPEWIPCQRPPGHDPEYGHRDRAGTDAQHLWHHHSRD